MNETKIMAIINDRATSTREHKIKRAGYIMIMSDLLPLVERKSLLKEVATIKKDLGIKRLKEVCTIKNGKVVIV